MTTRLWTSLAGYQLAIPGGSSKRESWLFAPPLKEFQGLSLARGSVKDELSGIHSFLDMVEAGPSYENEKVRNPGDRDSGQKGSEVKLAFWLTCA